MKRKNLRGGRAASSTKPSHPTVSAIPPVVSQNEDDAAVPKTSIESNHDQRYVREEGSKGSMDNDMDEGLNRSPRDSLGDDYICIDLMDGKICISCNEGGEVLVCTGRDCPVTLHAKCFCVEPKYDDRGNFYCPYCWYKRALAEAQEFRKNALLAKKDLSKFFRQIVIASDRLTQNDVEAERKEFKELSFVENGSGLDRLNRQGYDSVHSQPSKTVRDQQTEMERATTSADHYGIAVEDEAHGNGLVANTGDSRHYREEKTPVHIELLHESRNVEKFDVHNISETHETRFVEEKEEIELEDPRYNDEYVHARIVEDAKPLSAFRFGEYTDGHSPDIVFAEGTQEGDQVYVDNKGKEKDREKLVQNDLKVCTDFSVCEINVSDSGPLSKKKSCVKQWAQTTAYSQRVSSFRKSLQLKSNTGGKNVCYKNEEVGTSETLRLPRRSSVSSCSKKLTLQTGKRKRLNWTAEEENTLKEGVLRFAMENRNIPWKKILEFGCHVFDSNRTPADLKDKWKNMRV